MLKLFLFLIVIFNFNIKNIISKENNSVAFNLISPNFKESLSVEFFKNAAVSKNFYKNSVSQLLCKKQIDAINNGIITGQLWSYQVIDSWGKIPSGILMGHTTDLGNFDECIRLSQLIVEGDEGEYRYLFEGKYCTAELSIIDLLPKNKRIEFQPLIGWGPALATLPVLKIGICLPKICDTEQFDDTLRELFKKLNIQLNENKTIIQEKTCQTKLIPSYRTVDIVAIVIFSLFGFLMLFSSIYDYSKKEPIKILTAFSILSNGEKLFKIQNNSKRNSNSIECLNGIRSLSIIWVVFGHQYFTSTFISTINPSDMVEWAKSPFGLFMANGTLSVDSFFLLSGLLVTWVAFRTMEKTNGRLNIFKMYLHRYLRLTPLLAALILFTASLQRYTFEGPFKDNLGDMEKFCRENWWSTLLYVANYVHPDELCVGHSWYLCVDTQLFILSPIFLISLWKWGKITFIPMIMAIQASMGYVFAEWMYREYHYPLLELNQNDITKQKYTYYVTHARVSPYIIGMILGFYLYKNRNIKIKLSKLLIVIGWLMSLLIFAILLFGAYHRTSQQPGSGMTTIEGAIFEPFSRFSWAIALSWVIFACHNGFGGPINKFLTMGIWQPIARLSYGIYLSHLSVQMIWYFNYKTEHHFSDYETIFMFWACFGMTLCVSVVLVLAFESPVIVIENWIFGKKSIPKKDPVTIPSQTPVIIVEDTEQAIGWNVGDTDKNRRYPEFEESTQL